MPTCVSTWNIAGINNNPFEYWVTCSADAYIDFIRGVEDVIENEDELLVRDVFTDKMFRELLEELEKQNIKCPEVISQLWRDGISKRKAIREFLKDKSIGEKRLASMPDRITNTINIKDGRKLLRPTVINSYDETLLSSIDEWWEAWKKFMFTTNMEVFVGTKSTSDTQFLWSSEKQLVCSLIRPIQRTKYPAVTAEEQLISIQLQILHLAILDAIFIHIANTAAPNVWQKIRKNLCDALIHNKDDRICEILATAYDDENVIFLQEASSSFVCKAKEHKLLSQNYSILLPKKFDGRREQNSVMMLSNRLFDLSTSEDVTEMITRSIEGEFVDSGDLFALSIEDRSGVLYLLVSFHGDSNGLSTKPVITGLHHAFLDKFSDHIFIAGLDANTCSHEHDRFHHGVREFRGLLKAQGMVSSWDGADDQLLNTTCSARTSLQMQLNKAVSFKNRFSSANVSLKDWIIAYGSQVEIGFTQRDNSGNRLYMDETMLPTTSFPSDHVVVSCYFHVKADTHREMNRLQSSENRNADRKLWASKDHGRSAAKSSVTLYDYWGLSDNRGIDHLLEDIGPGPRLPARSSAETLPGPDSSSTPSRLLKPPRLPRSSSSGLSMEAVYSGDALGSDSAVWILFSSRPMSAALCKGWFRVLFIFLASIQALNVRHAALDGLRYDGIKGSVFRIGPVTCASDVAKVSDKQGCLKSQTANHTAHGHSWLRSRRMAKCASVSNDSILYFSGEDASLADGFIFCDGCFFATDRRNSEFRLDVGDQVGREWVHEPLPSWTLIRSVRWHSHFGGQKHFESTLVHILDPTPNWQWILDVFIQGKFWMVSMVACVLGAYGHGRAGTLVLAVSYFLNAAFFTAILASFQWTTHADIPFESQTIPSIQVRLLLNVLMSVAVAAEGHFVVDIVFLAMALLYGSHHISENNDPDDGDKVYVWRALMLFVSIGTALAIQVYRGRIRSWVDSEIVKRDRDVHDALWSRLLSKDEERLILKRLQLLSSTLSRQLNHREVRQTRGALRSQQKSGGNWFSSFRYVVFGRPSRCYVDKLDCLYEDAFQVHPLLTAKAKELALSSRGFYSQSIASPSRRESISSLFDEGDSAQVVLKPWARSVEKLVRSYGGDPSRILDCCRCAIIFQSTSLLFGCLETIIHDPDIEVVRIRRVVNSFNFIPSFRLPHLNLKNRMDLGYDGAETAGFRNVTLNLRFRTEQARKLGVDGHICELQLSLVAFTKSLNAVSHRRYHILRNCRQSLSGAPLLRGAARLARGAASALLPLGLLSLGARAAVRCLRSCQPRGLGPWRELGRPSRAGVLPGGLWLARPWSREA